MDWQRRLALQAAWDQAARDLVKEGYTRQNYPNPMVTTFHLAGKNGEGEVIVTLVREDPAQMTWQRKVIEPPSGGSISLGGK